MSDKNRVIAEYDGYNVYAESDGQIVVNQDGWVGLFLPEQDRRFAYLTNWNLLIPVAKKVVEELATLPRNFINKMWVESQISLPVDGKILSAATTFDITKLHEATYNAIL